MVGNAGENSKKATRIYIAVAILLIIPFIAYVLLPTYDRISPKVAGISFFYWYQTLWLAISGVLFGIAAYMLNRLKEES